MEFLIVVLISLVIIGLLCYVIQAFLPIDPRLKLVMQAALVILWLVWLLSGVDFPAMTSPDLD